MTEQERFSRTRAAILNTGEAVTSQLVGMSPGEVIFMAEAAHGGIRDLQVICHQLAKKSGWWNGVDSSDKNVLGTKLCLIHSEVSEALEGVRKDTMDSHLPHRSTLEVELADAVIRILDLAGVRNLDLAGAIMEKLAYNQQRADHKPENRAADGGKKI